MKIVKIFGLILLLVILYFPVKKFIRKTYYDFMYKKEKENTIEWNKNFNLEWSDFNYSKTKNSFTRVGIANRYEFNQDLTIDYNSVTLFYPKDSYVNDTTDLHKLQLNQARFDLCEIYRRKLEKKIITLNFNEFPESRKDSVDINTVLYYELFEQEWEKIMNLTENEKLNRFKLIKNQLND